MTRLHAPHARATSGSDVIGQHASVVIVSRMARPIALVAVVIGLLIAGWFGWQGLQAADLAPMQTPADVREASAAAGTIEAGAEQAAPTTPAADADDPTQRDAADVAAATTGSMLLTVVWGDDKSPATAVEVAVYRASEDDYARPSGRTDSNGQFVFEGLAPGSVRPMYRIGDDDWGDRVEIRAGQRAEATLEIRVGMKANGRVVDGHAAPVADAAIVVTDWSGGPGQELCRSAADGSFALRGLPNSCHVGARKRGYCPTPMRTFTTSEGAEVEFEIVIDTVGAGLTGTVFAPDGSPVANATVRAGSMEQGIHQLPDGGSAMAAQAELTFTDADGRFTVESVVPGMVPLAVRADGLAPWAEDVEVRAGIANDVTIRLEQGVTLFGKAVDDTAQPAAGVQIRVGDWRSLGHKGTRSADDGSYRLDGLAIGSLVATAGHEKLGKAKATFEVVAGETVRWDPVLSAGIVWQGRLLDHDGEPVESAIIEAHKARGAPGEPWWAHASPDAEGRFALRNLRPDLTIDLSVRRKSTFPELVLRNLKPNDQELVIRLEPEQWVHIKGRALGPDGEVLPSIDLSPFKQGTVSGTPVETVDPTTGDFAIGPYPPGHYTLRLAADGFPTIHIERTVEANATWDTGTLRFERGGTLAIHLVAAAGTQLGGERLSIYRGETWCGRLETEHGAGTSGPLAAGEYELRVSGGSLAAASVPFSIRAGIETRLDVPVRTGFAAKIRFVVPADFRSDRIAIVVSDGGGGRVLQTTIWLLGGSWARDFHFAPGSYSIVATAGDLSAQGSFTVGSASMSTTLTLQ